MTTTNRAAVRPTVPDSAHSFGPLGEKQAQPGVGEGAQDYAEKCRQVQEDDCFFLAMGEIDRC